MVIFIKVLGSWKVRIFKNLDFQKSGFWKNRIFKKVSFFTNWDFESRDFLKNRDFLENRDFEKSGFWKIGFSNFLFFLIFQVEINKWVLLKKNGFSKVRILKNRDFQKSEFSKVGFFLKCPFKQFRRNGTYMEVGFSKVPISPFGGRAEVTPLRGITFSIFHVL